MSDKRILLPATSPEQVKGWLLHCHKSRDRHDEMARLLDRRHWIMVWITAGISALAGVTLASDLVDDAAGWLGEPRLAAILGVLIGVAALAATFLSLLQKDARYGERAETHRRKAEAYKGLIWEIEQKWPLILSNSADLQKWCDGWRTRFQEIEEDYQIVAPKRIVTMIDKRCYASVMFVPTAEELGRGEPCHRSVDPSVSADPPQTSDLRPAPRRPDDGPADRPFIRR